ncbi:MAG: TVP38/TMEM64 family protein [Ezakiella sp.]|nr:TVP38/TMEM64 family protein [Ezakiella sp.]
MTDKNQKKIKSNREKFGLYNIGKIILTILIIGGSLYMLRFAKLEVVRDWVLARGEWAELFYVMCWVVLPIFLFPVMIIAFAGGVAFGFLKGAILTMIGAMINTIIMFYISRYIAKDVVNNLIVKRVSGKLREKLLTDNQKTLGILFFILRIMPVVSYNLENFLAGVTNLKLGVHLIETFFGIIPGVVIFLNFGNNALDTKSPAFIGAAILLALLFIIPTWMSRKYFGDIFGNNNNSDIQRDK